MSINSNIMLSHLESLIGTSIDHDNSGIGYAEEVVWYLLKKYWNHDLNKPPEDWDTIAFPNGFRMGMVSSDGRWRPAAGDFVIFKTTRSGEYHVGVVKGTTNNGRRITAYSQDYHHHLSLESYEASLIHRLIKPNYATGQDNVVVSANEYRFIQRRQDNYFSIILGSGPKAVDIGQMVDAVTKINRGVGSGWDNQLADDGSTFGQRWVRSRNRTKQISIDFIKVGDQVELARFRKEFAAAIDTTGGPKRLSFNDEPNIYYNAVVDGDVQLDEDISELRATGTVTFLVPDGLAHSTFTNVLRKGSDDTMGYIENREGFQEVVINNHGTVDAFPRIIIRNPSENGYIGIVNQNGVLEVGSSAQGPVERNAQVLLSCRYGDYTAQTGFGRFNLGKSTFPTAPHSVYDGIADLKNRLGRDESRYVSQGMMLANNLPKQEGYRWSSSLSAFRIPADVNGVYGSENFKLEFNIKFWQNNFYEAGHICVGITDENKELIFALDLTKTDRSSSHGIVEMYDGKDSIRDSQVFTIGRNWFSEKTGECSITKEGSKISVMVGDKVRQWNIPSSENRKAHYIYVSIGALSSQINANGIIAKMCLETISFTKLHVPRWDQVKNRYQEGSMITIDQKKGMVYYAPNANAGTIGGSRQSDLVFGSNFFGLPPGTSTLRVFNSSWMTSRPEITVEWEESWR